MLSQIMRPFFRFTITGVVQGVGFRPFIHQACTQAGLRGYVQNIGTGVVIVVDNTDALKNILSHLPKEMRIDSICIEETNETHTDFSIHESTGLGFAEIPPDRFLCDACLAELSDSSDRRHNYFFTTCTLCGPRFSVSLSSPYDRETTTMRDFVMCEKCRQEYTDPSDRRFHAQTIACHHCGPLLTLYQDNSPVTNIDDAEKISRIAEALKEDNIVTIKGVGGFHLFARATRENATRMNQLTGRKGKPYAVLCRDLAMAESISSPTETEKDILLSPARPIVLVKKNAQSPAVSELDTIGIMLASTALHILLFKYFDTPLICTSSNRSDAPLTTTREEQFVPLVLDHNRIIQNAVDDSVIKVIHDTPLFIRRSRGFVPQSIAIHSNVTTPLLALGAEMNNTFALYDSHGRIILSQHLGNTSHPDTFAHFQKTIQHFLDYTRIAPEVILCDAHPNYQTSRYGVELSHQLAIPLIPIQHHRAHAFAVAAEHGLDDFVAIVCDGLGYGDDSTLWGGEVFHNHTRIGHLETHPQLGGDAATRHPHKMLYAILRSFLSPEAALPFMIDHYSATDCALLEKQYTKRFNAPLTSSCGRVLDAAAALLDLCSKRTYDGRPAMLLESHSSTPLPLTPVIENDILLTTPLFRFLVEHLDTEDPHQLAATVQHYLAEGLYTIAAKHKKPIVWAGGCVYNRIMTTYFLERGVLVNRDVPPGDGGISFGQISVYLSQNK